MDKKMVIEAINKIKYDLQLKDTPQVILIHGSLSKDELLTIHQTGDCFVLPTRAEGFGVPTFEAQAMGKLVITTNFGGNLEFTNRKNSYLLDYFNTPVAGMHRPTYNGKMTWAEPSLADLMLFMRAASERRESGVEKAEQAKKDIESFSIENIGKEMISILEKV
jgi:glycosyltransferase involved in cell wall biosynthesis